MDTHYITQTGSPGHGYAVLTMTDQPSRDKPWMLAYATDGGAIFLYLTAQETNTIGHLLVAPMLAAQTQIIAELKGQLKDLQDALYDEISGIAAENTGPTWLNHQEDNDQ